MVSRSAIEDIANRASHQRNVLATEEAAKHALVLPFIQALGYDVFDPGEVVPEYTADYGIRSGEKVDYAIMHDGIPVMLIECKAVTDSLDTERASQLSRYFVNTPARIGILTNGIVYKFYSDLDAENTMDTAPFLEIDITKTDNRSLQAISHFTKQSFDLEDAKAAAAQMKYIAGMKTYLADMYAQPDDDFVRLLSRHVFSGPLFQSRMEYFNGLVRQAFHGFVNDRINETLQRASDMVNIGPVEAVGETDEQDTAPEGDESESRDRQSIVTTAEELEGYELVRTIVSDCVDPERVTMRDRQSYCAILLDNNNRRTICRLRFTSRRRVLALMGEERTSGGSLKEVWHDIETVNDITNYAHQLQERVRRYVQSD